MSRTTVAISDEVRERLKKCPITQVGSDWHLAITEQLDRAMYEAVNKVLTLAGGKWNRGAKAHIFKEDPRETLLGAVESGKIVDEKKVLQAYYTPSPLARRTVDAAKLEVGMKVLEPNCGMGAIACEIESVIGYFPDCVDLDPKACAHMRALGAPQVWNEDFLEWAKNAMPTYDRVVMNPPFTGGQDMRHVQAAFGLLKPGGVLVSIMSPHWTFAEDNASLAFRNMIDAMNSYANWAMNADGSFSESGTSVTTGTIWMEKRITTKLKVSTPKTKVRK